MTTAQLRVFADCALGGWRARYAPAFGVAGNQERVDVSYSGRHGYVVRVDSPSGAVGGLAFESSRFMVSVPIFR